MSEIGKRRGRLALELATAAFCSFGAQRAFAQTASTEFSSRAAVEMAVQNNVGLHIALLQASQARWSVTAEDGQYVPIFDASASAAHNLNPSLRGTTGTTVTTTDTINLASSLTQTFSFGTVLEAQVTGQRRVSASPPLNNLGGTNALGPAYSLGAQLLLTQPFLRGAGNTIGLASLRVAKLNRTAAVLATQQTASQVLHDVLTYYWELWYAAEAKRIDEATRDLAKQQQTVAAEQVKSGTLANVDALAYATQLATQEEAVVADGSNQQQAALTLAQAVGLVIRSNQGLTASEAPSDVVIDDIDERAVDEAMAASYQIKQLQAQLQIAQDQAKIAGDPLRSQLNLNASVGAQGLGNRALPPAFTQFGEMQAVSAQVGLSFETPVTDSRRQAQVEGALLGAHIAEQQIALSQIQLRTNVKSALARRDAAKNRVDLSRETERVSHAQLEGQKGKFASGTAVALDVKLAEDSYNQAQLRVTRARVDVVEAELDLLNLRGKLLERYADVLKSYKPTALILDSAKNPDPL